MAIHIHHLWDTSIQMLHPGTLHHPHQLQGCVTAPRDHFQGHATMSPPVPLPTSPTSEPCVSLSTGTWGSPGGAKGPTVTTDSWEGNITPTSHLGGTVGILRVTQVTQHQPCPHCPQGPTTHGRAWGQSPSCCLSLQEKKRGWEVKKRGKVPSCFFEVFIKNKNKKNRKRGDGAMCFFQFFFLFFS